MVVIPFAEMVEPFLKLGHVPAWRQADELVHLPRGLASSPGKEERYSIFSYI